ncbi:MAG: PAS domain-containing protein, partial [Burkholderiales bacterium]
MPVEALLLAAAGCACIVYLIMVFAARSRERELARSRAHEARLKSLTELSADWFWETDAEQRITWLSGGGPVATLFGDASTFGKRFWEIPRVAVEPRALEAHLERLARELPFFDLEISRTDARGARQVHIISGQSRRGADGRFLGYWGVGRDVTEQRRAEASLAAAKARLELALDGGNLAEWHYDAESDELYAGDGWVRFLGHERSPPVTSGEAFFAAVHPDDSAPALDAWRRALKGEVAEYEAAFRARQADGGWKWLHAKGRVTERDASGRAKRVSGIVADIEARRRSDGALNDAEER